MGITSGSVKTNIVKAYQPLPIMRKKLRFKNSQNALQIIGTLNSDQLAGCLGVIALNTTQGYMIASSIKINRIQMWSGASSIGENCSIKLNGGGTAQKAPNLAIYGTATTNGNSYLDWKPAKDTLYSMWLTSNVPLMTIVLPAYGIIEFDVSYQLTDSYLAAPYAAIGYASSGMTPAYMYYPCLDGSTRFVPQVGLSVY